MNISQIRSIHFVGIKGVAMTALAIVAKERGIKVSGSDTDEVFPTDKTLKRFGIIPLLNFSAEHVSSDLDLVIYTGAHKGSYNPEVMAAKKLNIASLSHGQALGLFMEGKKQISVAGSHGKTTTSSLIASLLISAQKDPSFAIGCGEIMNLQTSAHYGEGEWFVAEADEYVTDPQTDFTPRFLWQHPDILVITNIDFDHPDIYKDLSAVQDAFTQLIKKISVTGIVIANCDDEATQQVLSKTDKKIITYGTSDKADFRLTSVTFKEGETIIEVLKNKEKFGTFTLKIPGEHNALNATAAIAVAEEIGISTEEIKKGLLSFTGAKRRFELIEKINGKLLYDDYAHHPQEIIATLKAAKLWYPKQRLVVIFQPHTYTRTKALFAEFTQAFALADNVVITDIYASAREHKQTDVSAEMLVKALKYNNAFYAPGKADVVKYVSTHTKFGDILLTMGAGDIYSWIPEIQKAF